MSELIGDTATGPSPHDRLSPSRGFPWETDNPAPFDLRHTIDTVADNLTRRHGKKDLTLEVRYALEAPRFLIGPIDRIRQVMGTLMGRAVELATLLRSEQNGRGRVTVDVQGDRCADGCAAMRLRVEVSGRGRRPSGETSATPRAMPVALEKAQPAAPSNVLLASLQDGVPPAAMAKGGDPGLVSILADCRRLVELMGGRLGALTDPHRGSFVWLAMKLPVDASRGVNPAGRRS